MGAVLRRVVLTVLTVVILVPTQALAYEYEDTGFDPLDREPNYPDIIRTTRRVWTHDGRRFLRITFSSEEELPRGSYWIMRVRLDTRGDASFDALMRFWDLDNAGTGCVARKSGNRGERIDGRLHLRNHGASCRIGTGELRMTKQVRWKLRSPRLHSPGEIEIAPNVGYYS